MITIEHLTFGYSKRKSPVLNDLSLVLEPGRVYGLLGPNGAGKSTLLYLIAGLLTPVAGKVMVDNINTRKRLPSTLKDIFIVPEEFDLPPIKLSRYVKLNAKYYPDFSVDDMKRHLATFGMDDDPNLGKLSMGQKKKVFMAFALACNTKILLMDEPTNGLDIPGKSAFRRFIASNMNDDRLILISTHQVRDVDNLLDSIVIVDNSRLICSATVNEITDNLAFMTTSRPDLIESALFAQPGLEGTQIIIDNDGTLDTRMELELLFQYALQNGNQLKQKLHKNG